MNLITGIVQKRPGLLLPVFFFLSAFTANCQQISPEGVYSLTGGEFLSNASAASAWNNQACLAWTGRQEVSISHCRPALQPDLGIASVGLRLPFGRNRARSGRQKDQRGGFGFSLSNGGIPGYRFTSFWVSCGLELHPALAAGAGIHTWFGSAGEALFHHPGMGCALGILFKATPSLTIAGHLHHPFQRVPDHSGISGDPLAIAAGLRIVLFPNTAYYSEVKLDREGDLQFAQGMEIHSSGRFRLILAMKLNPLNLSCGAEVILGRWHILTGFQFQFTLGPTPVIQLQHGW